MAAFAEVVEQTRLAPSTRVITSDVPLSVYVDEVIHTVRLSRGPVAFLDFFRDEVTRPRVVGIFLALLELYRRRLIHVTELDGTLQVTLRDPEEENSGLRTADCGLDGETATSTGGGDAAGDGGADNRQLTTENVLTADYEDEDDDEDA